jgi:hypothetical protein
VRGASERREDDRRESSERANGVLPNEVRQGSKELRSFGVFVSDHRERTNGSKDDRRGSFGDCTEP